jgi:hypothetical protein
VAHAAVKLCRGCKNALASVLAKEKAPVSRRFVCLFRLLSLVVAWDQGCHPELSNRLGQRQCFSPVVTQTAN